ncbi:TIGR03364 family FAD-dependent oxidoreductase, partial [Sesbania bispinosa]
MGLHYFARAEQPFATEEQRALQNDRSFLDLAGKQFAIFRPWTKIVQSSSILPQSANVREPHPQMGVIVCLTGNK